MIFSVMRMKTEFSQIMLAKLVSKDASSRGRVQLTRKQSSRIVARESRRDDAMPVILSTSKIKYTIANKTPHHQ